MVTEGARTALLRLLRFILISTDADRLATFYEQALGCRRLALERHSGAAFEAAQGVAGAALSITLGLGRQRIELLQFEHPGRPYPVDALSSDRLFQHVAVVVRDMPEAFRRLVAVGGWSTISEHDPVRLPATSGGVTAFKFRDPEGHPLELLAFPASAIPEPWRHGHASHPCLGIDHSAISVTDTQRSVEFYRGLGLGLTGSTLNSGSEQAALDGLADPRVAVTALAAAHPTPHLELLCYQRPSRGNARVEVRNNDIAATRMLWEARAPRSEAGLHPARPWLDPDGHRLLIVPA